MRPVGVSLLVIALLFQPGCFHITGKITESSERKSTPSRTVERKARVPESEDVIFDVSKSEGDIVITAWQMHMCADEKVTFNKNEEVVERKLPGGYYGVLATGLVLAGAGVGLWAGGSSMKNDANTPTVGEPGQEERVDRGTIMIPIGIGATGLGALFLTSSFIDLGHARDDVVALPDSTEVQERGDEYQCFKRQLQSDAMTLSKRNGDSRIAGAISAEDSTEGAVRFSASAITMEFCPDRNNDSYVIEVNGHGTDVTHLVHPMCSNINRAHLRAELDELMNRIDRLVKEGDLESVGHLLGRADVAYSLDSQSDRLAELRSRYEKKLPAFRKKEAAEKARQEREDARERARLDREKRQRQAEYEREQRRIAAAEAKRRKLEESAPVTVSNIRPRIGFNQHVFLDYDVTAKKDIEQIWVPVRARCRDGNKTRVGESFGYVDDLRAGETKEVNSAFSEIERQSELTWCEFEYSTSNNSLWRGKAFLTVCWDISGVRRGMCE